MSATDVPATPPTEGPYDPTLKLVLPGKGLAAGAGWDWVTEGWTLFAKAPLRWIVSLLVIFVGAIAVGLVPFLGQLLFQLVQAAIAAGYMVACRSLEKGGEFEIEHLMAGFSRRFVPLLIVGALVLAGWIAILLICMAFVGVGMIGALMAGDPENAAHAVMASAGSIILGVLVMMHDMKPVAAMKESFFACFRNFVPFLVYSIVMMIAGFVAVIPFGLGMLVWVPVAIASTYVAYRQIFTED
jgi:hypothetical protein